MKVFIELTGFVIFTLLFYGCDPGYGGKTILNNQTSYTLELKFKTGRIDTIITVQPLNSVEVYRFGGMGAGRDYKCCPCEFREISLTIKDSAKTIKKLITNSDNWLMVNDNKRKYSGKEIICSFLLETKDIQ